MTEKTYKLVCKSCRWRGDRPSSASDKCPMCGTKLRLEASESRKLLQQATGEIATPAKKPEPVKITRVLVDKDAPKDEGRWEFELCDGVLTIIAYDDQRVSAKCVKLVRRGTDILQMKQAREKSEDEG